MYNNTCISIIIQLLQGNLFLLAVCTHEVPPYLCSIFCSHSLMQVSIANYHITYGVRNMLANCIL